MTLKEILDVCERNGISLRLEGEDLKVRAAKGVLTRQLTDSIKFHKTLLVEWLKQSESGRRQRAVRPIAQVERKKPLPLSFAQQRLWLVDQLTGSGAAYHIPGAVRLRGILNHDALRRTFATLVERHESLRTVFATIDGAAVQIIKEGVEFKLQEVDLRELSETEKTNEVARQVSEAANARFDLRLGPLFRARLLQVAEHDHVLLITMHHIVSDGWSLGVMIREVAALYTAYHEGRPNPLQPLPIQYADYAVWERGCMQGLDLEEKIQYWRQQLAGSVPLELPLDRLRPSARSYRGAVQKVFVAKEMSAALADLARSVDATMYMALLALYQLLLSRVSGQRDVVVASPIVGRTREETQGLIGFFVNMLLMRTHVDEGLTFCQLLSMVKRTALEAYAQQELPFDKLIAELRTDRHESVSALGRVAFALETTAHGETYTLPGLSLEIVPQSGHTAKTDLSLVIQEKSAGLACLFEYSTDLFDESTIDALARRFGLLIEQVVGNPNLAIKELDLTLPSENRLRHGLLPLSAAQRTMWLDLQVHPEMASYYSIVEVVELTGAFNPELFRLAISHTVNCTSALRLRFRPDDNGLLNQEICRFRTLDIPLIDVSCEANPEEAARAWIECARHRRINPVEEVPFYYALIKLTNESYKWYRQYHHLVLDGAGLVQHRERVAQAYAALVNGASPSTTNDESAYRDYLHRDAEYRFSARYAADTEYWRARKIVGGAATLSVRATGATSGDPIRVRLPLREELAVRLKSCADDAGVSFSRFVIAAVVLYLHKVTEVNHLTVGMPVHGRFDDAARDLIAACSNMLPVQFDIDRQLTVKEFLRNAGAQLNDLLRHGRFRIEDIRRLWDVRPSDPSLFNITINVLPYLDAIETGGCQGKAHSFPRYDTDLIFWVTFSRDYRHVLVQLDGNPRLYEQWELERHLQRVGEFLNDIVHSQGLLDGKVADVAVLGAIEREQVVAGFNSTRAVFDGETLVHRQFEAHARCAPDAIAVAYEEQRLTYAELNLRSNRLAHYLRMRGVGANDLVAICAERGIEMVVGLLGILKAGAAYVPLDPNYPRERLRYMVVDAAPKALLMQARLSHLLPEGALKIALDDEQSAIAECDGNNLDSSALGLQSRHLAYVIYTSGSTGLPKGVMVEHRQLSNLTRALQQSYGLNAADNVLQFAALSFDMSVEECFGALCSGCTLTLRTDEWIADAPTFWRHCADAQITVLNLPTAFWQQLARDSTSKIPVSIRQVAIGGEKVNRESIAHWFSRTGHLPHLVNAYGPTEATVNAALGSVNASASAAESIGRPLANTQIYILDSYGSPVPIGVVGELHVGGAGVARGYLNKPELTAERFLKDPFRADPQARMYKTGDLGRWCVDGSVEYLGRNDQQVKIRGFRIELGEIESQLVGHDSIDEAIVIVRADEPGEKRLTAYVTGRGDALNIEVLRAHLKSRLPDYMVPSAFVRLEAIPLLPNGKVNRHGLPRPEGDAYARAEYEASQGEIETALAAIWQELLHVERVGRHDNFFALGGHSLLAVQVISRVRRYFGRDLELREIFDRPTIQLLAQHLGAAHSTFRPAMDRVDRGGAIPLSLSQQRLWFVDHIEGAGAAYHISGGVRLIGDLNRNALQESLDALVERHEILRTTFRDDAGVATQLVEHGKKFSLRWMDLRSLAERDRESEIKRQAAEETGRRFSLGAGPLIRGCLLRVSNDAHVLLVTMHHIVSDGWSLGILIRELGELYRARVEGRDNPLRPLAIQYADYAAWQRNWMQAGNLERELEYWRKQLAGAPSLLELPTDLARPMVRKYDASSIGFRLSSELTGQLRDLSIRHDVTLYMILYAAYVLLLSRLSGQDDIVIGTPVANRQSPEVETLIGFFVNTLALRFRLDENVDVRTLMRQAKETTLDAYSHQELPFEKVVEALNPPRSLSHTPVFQVMLTLQNAPQETLSLPGLNLASYEVPTSATPFDLAMSLRESGEQIVGRISFATDIFAPATVECWAKYFQMILTAFVRDTGQPVSAVSLLSEIERHRVIVDFNDTRRRRPAWQLAHRIFEEHAAALPDALAVECAGDRFSYFELNARANRLASYLRERSVGPDRLVAICAERGIEMVTAFLGVLKAGGVYMPLDPAYPKHRLEYMLEDARPQLLLVQEGLEHLVPDSADTTVVLDERWREKTLSYSDENAGAADDVKCLTAMAYVIYTSGSTGRPKGVMVEHRGLSNLVSAQADAFDIKPGERVLQFAAPGFDASVWELVMALCHGATLCLPAHSSLLFGEVLQSTLRDLHVCNATLPPTALSAMSSREGLDELKTLVVAGEACAASLVRRWASGRRFFNAYGPTESTVDATVHLCDAQANGDPPIGRPITNTAIYILDRQLQPRPIGVTGEIFIGGFGVARGYLNRRRQTAEKFLPDPFCEDAGARMYGTGDLGRWRRDGTVEFIGRTDDQIKLRGYRIELGEIESQLRTHARVREAVVMVRESAGETALVAYVTYKEAQPTPEELRAHLLHNLPHYMLPSAFVISERFPLTANGKIDRKALPMPGATAYSVGEYAAPSGDTEAALALIWQSLLRVSRVGRDDDFFALGGHSLLAMRLIARVRQEFEIDVPVGVVFQSPTLKALATALTTLMLEKYDATEVAALSQEIDGLSSEELEKLLASTDEPQVPSEEVRSE